MVEALKEMKNGFRIVGILKSKNLEEKTTKAGEPAIMGNVVVEVSEGGRTHNISLQVFSKKFKKNGEENGLFKGYKTVADEYIAKDDNPEKADLIEVTGNIDINDYIGQDNHLHTSNRNRVLFFNRLTDDVEQQALATVESVITGYTDVVDSDGIPTGETKVRAATVGYNGKIIPLEKLTLPESLAPLRDAYVEGTTGTLTIKMNNYPVEKEKESADIIGFGITEDQTTTVVNYVSGLEIVGGTMPNLETGLTPEQVAQMKRDRKEQLAQVQAPVAQPTVNQSAVDSISGGFGTNIPQF